MKTRKAKEFIIHNTHNSDDSIKDERVAVIRYRDAVSACEIVEDEYEKQLENKNKELDILYECITELYGYSKCTHRIKEYLSHIEKINE